MNGERRRRRSARALAVPFWVACAGATGCLADPPTFAPRGQLPPFIIAGQVEPPLSSIYEGPRNIEINVPFRSEDVNDDLSAHGQVAGVLDDPREVAGPGEPLDAEGVSDAPHHLGDVRVRVLGT